MKIIRSVDEMIRWARECRVRREKLALVPTMGYFHEGHLSLMRLGNERADRLVVSLFVNPTQFGPGEDLDTYPRDFDRDRQLAESEGVDVLFAPASTEIYPDGFQTRVVVSGLTGYLCGTDRPGHFAGVTTVVCKLFNIVWPHIAVFGEKDFQQLAVIRRMVRDLNMDVEVIGHPIVRESDGLAMSSRNAYLDPEDRKSALCLSRSIARARKLVAEGLVDAGLLQEEITRFIQSHPATAIDYVSLVDCRTLEPVSLIDDHTLLALAVRIRDKVRLIDNGILIKS
ncbi:pantoate--beta-alanine ligase [Desulfolithobacter sp.]